MSKKKLFKLELFNAETEEIEIVEKFKFISWSDARDIVQRAKELDDEDDELAAFDQIPELILSAIGECKTSTGEVVTTEMISKMMSVEDMKNAMQEIMITVSGEDPKALPPELQ